MLKSISIIISLLLLVSCSGNNDTTQTEDYLNPELPVDKRVEILLGMMTLEEKIGQMCQYVGEAAQVETGNTDEMVGYKLGIEDKKLLIENGLVGSFLKVPGYKEANYLQELALNSRLKIPLLIATDAIHGHAMDIPVSTVFPSPIGIASSFDTLLAKKIAIATAKEMRATGFHWTFSPNLDLVRDSRWGRTGETYGEDPFLITQMGIAMIKGYQGNDFSEKHNVLACAKHLVAGGIAENGLNGAPADISERTLEEIFYPPFVKAIENKVYTVMPAHNEVNGIPCHADKNMLTNMLRNKWGFEGFVISDWQDIERLYSVHKISDSRIGADKAAVEAGVDMHMHGGQFLDNVKALVEDGIIPLSRIDDAVKKILTAKFRLGLFENRFVDENKVYETVLNSSHKELALEAARKSIVLLKNDKNVLPLAKNKKIFLTGPNANDQSVLGDWARIQPDSNLVTIYKGLKKEGSVDYLDCKGITKITDNMIKSARERAKKADVSIIVVGENSLRENPDRTSGENIDRASLQLQGRQEELINAVASAGKPVIVVLVNGAPISLEKCIDKIDAIIEAWEPGIMAGTAVADVIYGRYNPSGRLPITLAKDGQQRVYYNHKPSSYHRGKFKFTTTTPLYEFGHGLSYTTFVYDNFTMTDTISMAENLNITLDVKNTGKYAGEETVLVYLNDVVSSVTRPVRELKAFQKVYLNPGDKETLTFTLSPEDFSMLNSEMIRITEPGEFKVLFGNQAAKSFWVK
ncbi:MAG: glycoside hydrolase family 3 N-terminal domain-containing protein [Cytophagaceae bacterium]